MHTVFRKVKTTRVIRINDSRGSSQFNGQYNRTLAQPSKELSLIDNQYS
jgi:hypothetical protein